MHYVAYQRWVERTSGLLQRGAVAGKTTVLRDHVFRATHVCDAFASGLDQPIRGVVADHELVRLDAGHFVLVVGGVHHHHGVFVQRFGNMCDAVRHLRIEESIHAVSFQRGDFVLLARLAVGADCEQHVAVGTGRILCAQNDAACVWCGGNFLADEAEDSGFVGTQASRQRIDFVPELGRFVAYEFGERGIYPAFVASVEHQGYSGDGYPRLFGDFLHCRHNRNTIPK